MTETSKPKYSFLYIFLLGLISILLLAATSVFIYVNPPTFLFTNTPSITISPTITLTPTPAPTRTPNPTVTLTPRPSWTPRPQITQTPTLTTSPSHTATRTLIPTITPALPYKINDRYSLNAWDFQAADRIASLLGQVPDTQYPTLQDRNTPEYNAAFFYAAYGYREALLRSPQAPQATEWIWGLAYAEARLGEEGSVQKYADLMLAAFQNITLRPQDLPEWMQLHEPRLSIQLHPLPVKPGYLSRYILQIPEGGVYLLLLQTPDAVRIWPLTDQFDFLVGPTSQFLVSDLTGDGIEEFTLYQPANIDNTYLTSPIVISLTEAQPVELPVAPSLPVDFQTPTQPDLQIRQMDGLALALTITAYPACPVTIQQTYAWDGRIFQPAPLTFAIEPIAESLAYCEVILNHAAVTWSPEAVLPLMETLLPLWPPATNTLGRPYPQDGGDFLRLQLGITQALAGFSEEAINTLQEIEANPSTPNSQWVQPAKDFLRDYQNPKDIYLACQQSTYCDPAAALRQLTHSSTILDTAALIVELKNSGVQMRTTGVFDFDQDGTLERWFTVQHRPGQRLEFWFLIQTEAGLQALFVDSVEVNNPQPYASLPEPGPFIFQLEARKGFYLERLSTTQQVYLTPVSVSVQLTTYTRDALLDAEAALLSGVDPEDVRDSLLWVLNSGRFNCKTHQICDRFYYTLGLAYELSNNHREAIDTYIQLWWENSKSPLTTAARLKLIFIPRPTFSPTPSKSPTVTPTRTATPTATDTPDPNATATITLTATLTPTDTETPTLTLTPSDTPTATEVTPYP